MALVDVKTPRGEWAALGVVSSIACPRCLGVGFDPDYDICIPCDGLGCDLSDEQQHLRTVRERFALRGIPWRK